MFYLLAVLSMVIGEDQWTESKKETNRPKGARRCTTTYKQVVFTSSSKELMSKDIIERVTRKYICLLFVHEKGGKQAFAFL